MDEGRRVAANDARPLVALSLGTVATVVSIEKAFRAELALEGVHIGSRVVVRARTPLRGPLLLSVGRGRVAVARSVAASVSVLVDPVARAAS